jgi:signal transduction histidine kinase
MEALLDLLGGTALDAEQRGHVEALREAADGMRRLVEDALALARLDAGAAPAPRAERCEVRELLDGVARTLGPLARARGLTLDVEVRADAPAALRTDAALARQVLLDLAGNAVRHTRRGGVRLVARGAAGGAALDVVDTGPGLTEAQRARLFTPWDRLAPDEQLPPGGSGLGLALARAAAGRLGGRLEVASVHGVGSTFTLALPG